MECGINILSACAYLNYHIRLLKRFRVKCPQSLKSFPQGMPVTIYKRLHIIAQFPRQWKLMGVYTCFCLLMRFYHHSPRRPELIAPNTLYVWRKGSRNKCLYTYIVIVWISGERERERERERGTETDNMQLPS